MIQSSTLIPKKNVSLLKNLKKKKKFEEQEEENSSSVMKNTQSNTDVCTKQNILRK